MLLGDILFRIPDPFLLTSSVKLRLASQLDLSLSFKGLAPLQILVGGVVVGVGIVWVGNEGPVIIAEIRVIGRSSGVLRLLPTEEFSVTGGGFSFAGSTFSGNRPGVGVLETPVAVVNWSIVPHRLQVWLEGRLGEGADPTYPQRYIHAVQHLGGVLEDPANAPKFPE